MYWKDKELQIGETKVGKTVEIIFYALDYIPKIKKVLKSCDCASARYDSKRKRLIVKYKPRPIPVHLRSQGYYRSTKRFKIIYVDGAMDVLSFTTKVLK